MNKQKLTRRTVSCSVLAAAFAVSAGCVADLGVGADEGVDVGAVEGDDKAIVGGASTTIDQHPWQISLQSFGSHFCGGSIIAPGWVLTAQHCVDGESASDLSIVAGTSKLSRPGDGQTRKVAQIIRFPGYSSPEFGKDVSLLKLTSPLTFNANVQAIPLAIVDDNATVAGSAAVVSGWGTTRSGGSSMPDQLKAVTVPQVSNSVAQQSYSETITADQLSAGAGGRDSCQGDSGGPLTSVGARGRVLIGVVSWGYGCGDAGYPGFYARVTSFNSWIAQQTGIAIGGGSSTTNPPTDPPAQTAATLLDRDVSGARGSFQHFQITVPAGAASLDVVLSGSSGDADLYVRQGNKPTATLFNCRPYTDSSNEVCSIANQSSGTWYVSVAGYTAYTANHVSAVVH